MNSIYVFYLVHLGYVYVVHLGWETNSKATIICLFIKLKLSSACYHYFWIHPLVVTITLDFCMPSLHNITISFLYACQILFTVMLNMQIKREDFCVTIHCHTDITPWWVQRQTLHPSPDCNPEEDICSEADSDAADHSYLPPRCQLKLGMMMLVISCICVFEVPIFDIIYVICLVQTCSVMPAFQFLYHI